MLLCPDLISSSRTAICSLYEVMSFFLGLGVLFIIMSTAFPVVLEEAGAAFFRTDKIFREIFSENHVFSRPE